MRSDRILRQAVAIVLAVCLGPAARGDDPIRPPSPPSASALPGGRATYARYCVSCHGERGDGRGPSAPWLDPRPRDFTRGVFKWRSTPSGTLPLDEDLFRTIRSGVYFTQMAPWVGLSDAETRDVVAWVEHFSPRFEAEPRGVPVTVPPAPAASPESIDRGKQLFVQACASCHGEGGRGDGPAARSPGLFDEQGNRLWPADLAIGHFKSSQDDRDLFRVLLTGLDGTPMPSFAEALTPQQIWDLVHYVRSLARPQ